MLLVEGHRQQQTCGKTSKNEQASCFVSSGEGAGVHQSITNAGMLQMHTACQNYARAHVRVARTVSPKAHTAMLRRARQRAACPGDTEALRRNEKQIHGEEE